MQYRLNGMILSVVVITIDIMDVDVVVGKTYGTLHVIHDAMQSFVLWTLSTLRSSSSSSSCSCSSNSSST